MFLCFLSLVSFTVVSVNQGMQSSLGIGFIYTFSNVVGILVTIFCLFSSFGLAAFGVSSLLRGFFQLFGNLLYMFYRLRTEKIKLVSEWSTLKVVVELMGFNFLGKLGGIGNSQVSLFLITRYLSPVDSVAYRMTIAAPESSKLFLGRPVVALMPSLTHLIGEGDFEKVRMICLRLLMYMIWASGIVFLGFICLNRDFVKLWTGIKFFGGESLSFMLILWVIISTFTTTFSHISFAFGNFKGNSIASISQALLYGVLMLIGLKYYGLKGAGFAILIAEIAIPSVYFPFIISKHLQLDYSIAAKLGKETLKAAIIVTMLYLLFSLANIVVSSWVVLASISVALAILYFVLLIFSSFSFRSELSKFRAFRKY